MERHRSLLQTRLTGLRSDRKPVNTIKMSTEAEGSAPSYHDSVREMMLELKKNKSSNKSSTNAAKSSTGNNEEKCEQVLVRNFFQRIVGI